MNQFKQPFRPLKGYENDRRAGKTHPDKRERIEPDDPRFRGRTRRKRRLNRADRRAMGQYKGATPGAPYRRVRALLVWPRPKKGDAHGDRS